MRRKYAFTLIELLVVISIIALLIGILLPALSASRELAIRSKCAQQVRQVLIAQFSYATDERGRLFSPILPPSPTAPPANLEILPLFMHGPARDAFRNYATDLRVTICPSFEVNTTVNASPEQLQGEVNFPRNPAYGFANDTWFSGYFWNTVAYVADEDRPDSIDDLQSDKTVVADVVVNLSSLAGATSWALQNYRGHVNKSYIPAGSNVGRLDGSTAWKSLPDFYAKDPLPSTTMADWDDIDKKVHLTPHLHTGDGSFLGRSARPARPWFH